MQVFNLRSALQKPEFITSLRLNRMNLEVFPMEVFRLPNLQELDLSFNRLRSLPPEIGRLKKLERLLLAHNELDSLPFELGRLRFLKELRIEDNQIGDWPEVLNDLPQLERLDLSRNQLKNLPDSAGRLSRLRELNLARNLITKLPAAIGRWTELRALDLSRNRLSRLASDLGRCLELDRLDLSFNRLRQLPPTLSHLEKLRFLDLSKNRFSALPPFVFTYPYLRRLAIAGNQIEDLPEAIARCAWLALLDLNNNRLIQLPGQIANCRRLQVLLLNNNRLEKLPPLSDLSQLQKLEICKNQLKKLPPLPEQLRELDLAGNHLTRGLAQIGRLRQLQKLNLADNPYSALPANFQQLKKVRQLDLRRSGLQNLPLVLLQLDQLQKLKGDWPSAQKKSLLYLLKALVKEKVPTPVRSQLYVFLTEEQAAGKMTVRTLFWALNLKHAELRRRARTELFRRFGRPAFKWPQSRRLPVLGKTISAASQLKKRLHDQNITTTKEIGAKDTCLLLGEYPGWQPALDGADLIYLNEPQVVAWLDQVEGRFLRSKAGAGEIDSLRELLLHSDPVNVQLAVQLMQGGGVPEVLLTELLVAWKKTKAGKLRREIKQLLHLYTPESARGVLELPLSLSRRQPEALLRANIARLCEETPFEAEKIYQWI